MKSLRKKYGSGIRFFACGEYGEGGTRKWNPHYHLIIFNHDFEDKELWKRNKRNEPVYISPSLARLWPMGFSSIGAVTFESAAYVARYIMKKVTGEQAENHYEWIDPDTGEICPLEPEFTTMSRRPGIGHDWYQKWKDDVFPSDFIIVDGRKMRPPKYYDRLLEEANERERRTIRGLRVRKSKDFADDNTPERRRVREKVKTAQTSVLKREI